MTDRRVIHLIDPVRRQRAIDAVRDAPANWIVEVKPPTRSLEANALLWVYLTAFSEQLEWPVNGKMTRLEPDDWKTILSASFKREQARIAHGVDGGMVMLGLRTSKMNKRQFAELMEFIQYVAAERGVVLEPEFQE